MIFEIKSCRTCRFKTTFKSLGCDGCKISRAYWKTGNAPYRIHPDCELRKHEVKEGEK